MAQNAGRKPVASPAIWEPPTVVDLPQNTKATVRKDMVKALRLSGHEIVLEKTDLAAVQKIFGGVMGHRGDAGDSLSWLCLHSSDSHEKWVLWLLSSEIDADSVGGFRWQLVENTRSFDSRCQSIPGTAQSVDLPVALRLGMTKDEVLHTLGNPSGKARDALFYLHEHELTLHNHPYTDMNTMTVLLSGNTVRGIEVWKSTTS